MLKKFLKFLRNQTGQMLVLYGLTVPVMFLAGATAVDLGWYYMNVSRLQNTADAAVMAGAKVLVDPLKNGELTDYSYSYLLPKVPDSTALQTSARKTDNGDAEVKNYIVKNLSGNVTWHDDKIQDNYNDSELNFTRNLYKNSDDDYKPLYYEITLTEKYNHLFNILNSLDTVITVKSAAKFTHNPEDLPSGPTLTDQMEALRDVKVYEFFEVMQEELRILYDQKKAALVEEYINQGHTKAEAEALAKSAMGGDRDSVSLKQARDRAVETTGNYWDKQKLNNYRTESSTLRGIGGENYKTDQYSADELFVNFRADVTYKFTGEDWDLDSEYQPPELGHKTSYNKIFDGSKVLTGPEGISYKLRIHSLIGIESKRNSDGTQSVNQFPYKVRADKEAPDPLYLRIESETVYLNKYSSAGHNAYNSVRQIIINVNYTNTLENDRPMVFFYDGPEKINATSHIRDSKTVILNFNADFRGILYAPNSPVAILGNNHNFRGFIVAKKFVRLKTAADFLAEGYEKAVRKNNNDEIYVKPDDVKESETETIPENCIEINYKNDGKVYYIENTCQYFTKIVQERIDGKPNFQKVNFSTPIFIDNRGNVVEKSDELVATVKGEEKARKSEEPDNRFSASDFNLASSEYDAFLLVKLVNYDYLNPGGSLDNMFVYSRAKHID